MNRLPKILLAAPTSDYKDYIFLDWFFYVTNLTYKNYDILLVDNSHDITYFENLKQLGVNVMHVCPEGKTSREYVTESQNLIRDYFLKNDYDYLFSLEVDIFPPRNIIEKLLLANKDIVGAPYFYNFGPESMILLQYFIKKQNGTYATYNPDLLDSMIFFDGTVKQCYENGIGCTLIKRRIIEQIPFRWEKGNPGFSDTHFYKDLFDNHITNYIDTSVICRHYNNDWSKNTDHVLSKDVDVYDKSVIQIHQSIR